ncbi:intermembrane lipid transfer protein VPS13C-like [Corticium candelabrum]|uniref:intermembrane lipid transfer protein VPS13C-like n=1 Tax=Corticium candelabrum TaxID=121492 RepID=UPI002E26E75F|nr:intermembrane lipid transfer protein VPS13C-like [Corticium candelabrum]
MQHLKVKVEDIHIVYRDIVSVPRSPFVLGFSLDSIIMETDNPSQCETDCVGKKLYLNSLALYWNTGVGSKNELTWQYLKDHIARTATSVDSNSYLLKPVSAEAKLKINYGSDLGTSVPKMSAAIQLDDLTVELSSLQFRDMIKLYNMWDMMDRNSPYRKYQPKTKLSPPSPCNVVRQWWQYAINGVIEVQIKPSRWYLDKMLQHWLWFKEYLSCFEQKLKQPNLPPNVIRKLKV